MLKKTLFIAAVAAAISGAAFAGGDVGYMAPMPAATTASDFNPGIYVGVQGGYADSGWDNVNHPPVLANGPVTFNPLTANSATDETGVAARAFMGYAFHKNFAVEAGYTYLFNKAELLSGEQVVDKARTQIIDLVGKMSVPIDSGFALYAKAGVGYMMSDFDTADNTDNFGVVYGVGASYDVTPNFMVDLSWTRFSGSPEHDNDYQPDVDFYAIGLGYKFDI